MAELFREAFVEGEGGGFGGAVCGKRAGSKSAFTLGSNFRKGTAAPHRQLRSLLDDRLLKMRSSASSCDQLRPRSRRDMLCELTTT